MKGYECRVCGTLSTGPTNSRALAEHRKHAVVAHPHKRLMPKRASL